MVFSALNPRNRSLPRGTVLVLGSLILNLRGKATGKDKRQKNRGQTQVFLA